MGKQNQKKNKGSGNGRTIDRVRILRGSLPVLASGSNHMSAAASVSRVVGLDLPIVPIIFSTAAGALAQVVQIAPGTIVYNFSGRFGSTFVEYRVIGLRLRARVTSPPGGTGGGIVALFLDEKVGGVPTATTTLDHPRVELSASATADKVYELDWVANDLLDLEWTPIGTANTPVYFKAFQDAANFGGVGSATIGVTGAVRIQFRGLV